MGCASVTASGHSGAAPPPPASDFCSAPHSAAQLRANPGIHQHPGYSIGSLSGVVTCWQRDSSAVGGCFGHRGSWPGALVRTGPIATRTVLPSWPQQSSANLKLPNSGSYAPRECLHRCSGHMQHCRRPGNTPSTDLWDRGSLAKLARHQQECGHRSSQWTLGDNTPQHSLDPGCSFSHLADLATFETTRTSALARPWPARCAQQRLPLA